LKAGLALDRSLGAPQIAVDTSNRRFVLRGSAHDVPAPDRATQPGRRVDGFTGVENPLQVGKRVTHARSIRISISGRNSLLSTGRDRAVPHEGCGTQRPVERPLLRRVGTVY
jgi:hypothetical protein